MIRWRVGNIVKRSADNSDDVRLADLKRMCGLDRECISKNVLAAAFDDQQ